MTEPLLTARQVAELLGFAPGTIVDWAEAGRIPRSRSEAGCGFGCPRSRRGSRDGE
jgi:hypothetical protein